MRVDVLHGPNLNLLGQREPSLYGTATLAQLDAALHALAHDLSRPDDRVEITTFQSNHEGALVDRLQQRGPEVDAFIVNLGGYSHTSVALRDAALAVGKPVIEVHLTNIYAREPFRQRTMLADVARGCIVGFGVDSYLLALRALVNDGRRASGDRRS